MTNDDLKLVGEYAASQSEIAFTILVERYTNFVYSAAWRQVQDPHLAGEVTQAVFLLLARKAGALSPKTILPGWLYRTTHYVACSLQRREARRRRLEQEAYMESITDNLRTDSSWEHLSPILDEAMLRLRDNERNAILLRYFENKTLREVGATLGMEERAAQKRVTRGLEKLRVFFARRGVALSAAAITGIVSANSVQAAPAGLSVSVVATTKSLAVTSSTPTLIKGALKIMAWSKAKFAVVIGLSVVLAGTATTMVIQHQNHIKTRTDFPKSAWATVGSADAPSALASVLLDASRGDGEKLLADLSPGMRQKFQQQFEKQTQAQGITLAQLISQMGNHWSSGVQGFHIVSQETNDDQVALHIQPNGKSRQQTFTMKKIDGEWKLHNFKDQ